MADSTTHVATPLPEKKIITITSSDGEEFKLNQEAALLSQTITHLIEDGCANAAIPLPNVTSKTLSKVIEYCNKHTNTDEDSVKAFDKEFMNVEQHILYDLIMAANYLNINSLLDLTCQTVADMIKGKSPEQIRAFFNIENDFTEEEEAEIRRENAWAFE